VVPVGTAADNSQEVPSDPTVTGWWRDGSRPGESGNTVIVGHTKSRGAGVFDALGKLREGDSIALDTGGPRLTYAVTETSTIPVDQFGTVADSIYRRSGRSGLVLLTCGDFDGREFDSTVIVHAALAG